ncbi:hypothetical protein PR003_g2266 [Phytophthora rubi]|uniref:RxLR effector protein n=1 Tax=Phytophthora rubi TaxID=129364 RepID=A0A6A3P5G4_9STRA|nr:hypothetical protein PR002_g2031 [Phytophthora rubi]KAE9050732.1 hypothetical protein PR001_g2104 [Phytophthora rubi]KAE9356531.1 hypothetical protein PR003_g2266 [Phytophthora rubi]
MNLAGSKTYLKADVAQKLEEFLHKSWVGEATSAKGLFAKLKLDSQGDKLFESPVFSTWVGYVTKLDAQNADDLVLSTLKTSYTDYALATLLMEARTNDDMKVLADKLAEAQRKNWLSDGKSADDVFKLLKLDDEADDLLKSPMLSNCVAYVKQLKENPYAILLEKLKVKFGDSDSKFADMLMEAKKDTSTSAIAGKIEAVQLEKWLNDGKTASDLFKLLKLEKEGAFILWYRRVRMWVAYASKVDPKNSDELIASVLKAHNNDKALGEMISVGRNHDEEMAVKFQEVVLNMWLREKKSADDVFGYVLKRHGEHFLKIPRDLSTWAAYVTKLDKEDAYNTMVAVLNRYYDKKTLIGMLNDAKETSGSELIAKKLQQVLAPV